VRAVLTGLALLSSAAPARTCLERLADAAAHGLVLRARALDGATRSVIPHLIALPGGKSLVVLEDLTQVGYPVRCDFCDFSRGLGRLAGDRLRCACDILGRAETQAACPLTCTASRNDFWTLCSSAQAMSDHEASSKLGALLGDLQQAVGGPPPRVPRPPSASCLALFLPPLSPLPSSSAPACLVLRLMTRVRMLPLCEALPLRALLPLSYPTPHPVPSPSYSSLESSHGSPSPHA